MTRFGFVVHPLNDFQSRVYGVRTLDPKLFLHAHHKTLAPSRIALPSLTTINESLSGCLVSLPNQSSELLEDQVFGVQQVVKAVEVCQQNRCTVVGLGGVAAMIGGQGKAVSKAVNLPVTSGNHLTAETAFQTTLRALHVLEPKKASVALVGLPSPVGLLILRLLNEFGIACEVVSRTPPRPLQRQTDALTQASGVPIQFAESLSETRSKIVIAASSTGMRLPLSTLPPHRLYIDVAAPADIEMDSTRDDVAVIDGEYLSPPNPLTGDLWQRIYGLITRQPDALLACFVEPMLIALSGKFTLCGVGRNLEVQKARQLGELATAYGFIVDRLYRFGYPIDEAKLRKKLGH